VAHLILEENYLPKFKWEGEAEKKCALPRRWSPPEKSSNPSIKKIKVLTKYYLEVLFSPTQKFLSI
jgi:hypothetical protein